ncbi:hypothetical protein [Vreelandella alkaliphila]|uniref:Uncharacterized protein n=1 Tax=Vreelandella alkaliphila TaxID=272774 RepID=A0AAJ2RTZ1_9GAMM|nr:hypothetical protein [Halomonas alkaliphila]MDX5978408.1 hypothetical protein [Halomonas alkaliphila]
MKSPLDTLRGSILSQVDIVASSHENEWEVLSHSPRYTLDELLYQCDPAAPEIEDIIAWQDLKKVGREE